MQIESVTNKGLTFWRVDTWAARGLKHGFIGRAIDVKASPKAWSQHFSLPLCLLRQEHGNDICRSVPDGGSRPRADAWYISQELSRSVDAAFGIITADCVPVLLSAERDSILAAAHCGWKGAASGLLSSVIETVLEDGAVPADIELAFGPAAGGCCYEVGEEVAEELLSAAQTAAGRIGAEIPQVLIRRENGRILSDIRELLRLQARSYGIPEENLASSTACTICDERFFSHRREKQEAGRQVSFIAAGLYS